jgi:hypothetical protein
MATFITKSISRIVISIRPKLLLNWNRPQRPKKMDKIAYNMISFTVICRSWLLTICPPIFFWKRALYIFATHSYSLRDNTNCETVNNILEQTMWAPRKHDSKPIRRDACAFGTCPDGGSYLHFFVFLYCHAMPCIRLSACLSLASLLLSQH